MVGLSVKTKGSEQIAIAAGDWFARRDSAEWTAAEEASLQAWLAESPLHRVAFLRIEHAWQRAQRLKTLKNGAPSYQAPHCSSWFSALFLGARRAVRPALRSNGRLRISSSWLMCRPTLGVAAGLAAVLLFCVTWILWPPGASYSTPVGGLKSVNMRDGSTVILNTDTVLRVVLTKSERLILLKRGEAFFKVAKDPERPFVVQVDKREVMAVGTQFSVRREGSSLEVIVTEGTVRLEPSNAVVPHVNAWRDRVLPGELLPAGTVARIGEAGVLIQKETPTEAAARLSWRQGMLVFRDVTLDYAIAEFNRYNIRQVAIAHPSLGALKIAGRFRADDVDAFVRLIVRGYPVTVSRQAEQLTLNER